MGSVLPLPPKSRLLSLPPEIRNTIYELLVIKDKLIRVCSPRRKHVVNKELTSKSFSVLLRLNKQINAEASTIFYAKNRFVFGNGTWGSTSIPNAHGLKAFRDRVPRKYLVHIADVLIEVHCRQQFLSAPTGGFLWVPANPAFEFGTMNDAKSLHSVSRTLGAHFKGLEQVEYVKETGPNLYTAPGNPDTTKLSINEVIQQLAKTLLLVLLNTNLKEIRTFSSSVVDMEDAIEIVLAKKPDAAKVLKVVNPRIPLSSADLMEDFLA